MNRERLARLAFIARSIPLGRFDMRYFECGTMMCLAGWAAVDPMFNEQGLKWGGSFPMRDIRFQDAFNGEAVKMFFDLTEKQTSDLFFDIDVKHPHVMADRIQEMLK